MAFAQRSFRIARRTIPAGTKNMRATDQNADSPPPATFGSEPAALPLYAQVKKHLIHRVLSGEWQPGKRLPSEAEIAQGYGLSLGTVRKAIKEMVDEGLVARWPGRGTFVTSHGPGGHRPFRFNCVHRDDGERMAGQPTRYLDARADHAHERAAAGLRIDAGDPVSVVVRVRQLHEQPVLIETSYLSEATCPGAQARLWKERPDSVYQLLEQAYGILVTRVEEKVRARAATDYESTQLQLEENTPVLEIERTAFSLSDERVEWRTIVCETEHFHYLNQQKR